MEILGLFVAFVVIVTLIMKRVNLGYAMVLGSTLLAVFAPKIGIIRYFDIMQESIFNQATVELVLVIFSIGLIAKIMDKTGLVDQMIAAMSILFRKFQPILIGVPSVLGALTIPGGAMLSAPMVNNIAKDLNLSNAKKMGINLLFRHIWYFVFPFTPALILSSKLIGYDVFYLIRHLAPLAVALGVVGALTLFRGLENPEMPKVSKKKKVRALGELMLALLPLIIGIGLPFIIPMPFWVSLWIGVVALFIYKRDQITPKLVWKSLEWKLTGAILGIMIFKGFINNLDSLPRLANGIIEAGLPLWFLAVSLPALVGFLTGSTSGAIGVTFPLLAPLIGGGQPDLSYVVLMYGSAFFSYYLSPVHFCLILTAEYFEVGLRETYKELILPTLAGIGMMILLFFLY